MSNVASLLSYVRSLNSQQMKAVADARQARAQLSHNPAEIAKPPEPRVPPPNEQKRDARKSAPGEDRRKVCQRFLRQSVLFDSRSGIDRRQHNQREGDIVEHISENA